MRRPEKRNHRDTRETQQNENEPASAPGGVTNNGAHAQENKGGYLFTTGNLTALTF